MKHKWLFISMLATFGTVASGCSHAPLSHDFGMAANNNLEQQAINPNAGKRTAPMVTLDGSKGEKALESYRTDSGKAPTAASTSGKGSSR